MNILLIDDEIEILNLIELYLSNEGFNVFKALNGQAGLEIISHEEIHLAILDLMLPDIDGFSIASKIRENYSFPIIMLTAKISDMDKIAGLNLGADDYITKPFQPLELIARVKAQLRRYTKYSNLPTNELSNSISIRGLKLYKDKHIISLDDQDLMLTPIEFKILKILMENVNLVVSSESLFEKVWQEKYYSDSNNTVMVHIRNIRKKMNDSFDKPTYIKTIWGVGYKIEE